MNVQELFKEFTGSVYTEQEILDRKASADMCLVEFLDGALLGAGTAYILTEEQEEEYEPVVLGEPRAAFLEELAVLPSSRGKGVGKTIARRLINWARLKGAPCIYALCWESGQDESRPMLEKMGFEKLKFIATPWLEETCPLHPVECTCDAWLLRLWL